VKRTTIVIGVLALGIAFCGLRNWAEAKTDDVAQIKAVEQGIATAAKARELDTIMKNYPTGDTLIVFDVAPPRQYQGYDAFRKDWQNFLGMLADPITYDLVDLNVITDGKMGYARMIQHVAGKTKDGKPVELNVRVTDVLRKTNGHWLIIHEHASFPVDLATGKADLLSKQ